MRFARCLATLATLALGVVAFERDALADPQFNAGLTMGAAGVGYDRKIWKETDFHFGLRTDLLFGRSKNSDFGIGPYAEFQTLAFTEFQFGGGVSFLVPVIDSLPLVFSAGAYGRKGGEGFGVEPGVMGEVFWGS